jgi:LacI family transcriptional regulator
MRKKTLLYYDTADKIAEFIVAKKMHKGTFLPPERELALKLKVSVVTLKKALKYLCEENILETIPRRGTMIKNLPVDTACKVNKRKKIGITIHQNINFFQTDSMRLIASVGEAFPADNYEVIIVYITSDMLHAESWQSSLPTDLDGLLVSTQGLPAKMLNEVGNSQLPVVFIEYENFTPGAWINEEPGIYKTIKYLKSLGHERIAFISGPSELLMVQKQTEAFKTAIQGSSSFDSGNLITSVPYERRAAFTEVRRMLNLQNPPSAFLLGDEFMAQGALDAIQASGLRSPEDVSVICFGGISISQQSYPQLTILTTVFNQYPGLLTACALMLRDILEGKNTEKSIIVERELVIGESTGSKK